MNKQAYMTIKGQLDFRPAWMPVILVVALDVAMVAAAVLMLRHGAGWAFATSQVLLAVVFFNAFGLLHDCGHGSATPSKLANVALGHLASTFCFIPFYPWKYIHQKHHTWSGNLQKDPVLKSMRTFQDKGVPWIVRVAWWSWVPLAAFLQHFVYLLYPLQMHREGTLVGARRWRCLMSILWLPASYGLLWLAAPELLYPRNFIIALLLFHVLEELANLPHHVAMPTFDERLPLWEQHKTTRSCDYPRGLSELIVLNFNFHIEHHLFPSLPWYRLRRARALVKPALAADYTECRGIAWNLENRKRDLAAVIAREKVARATGAPP